MGLPLPAKTIKHTMMKAGKDKSNMVAVAIVDFISKNISFFPHKMLALLALMLG